MGDPSAEEEPDQREGSEFGAGVVVCLAKFSEHLQEHGPYSERYIRAYASLTEEGRENLEREAVKYPCGESAELMAHIFLIAMGEKDFGDGGGREKAISRAIELWANAASDHFYDLDQEKAPEPLKALASLVLTIGHGFTSQTWTIETLDRIRDLWQQSCLELDRRLGVEPDWGHY